MNNNNKKRLFIAAIFLLLLFLLMTFAGGNTEVAVVEFIDGFDDSVIDTQQVEIGEDAKVPEDPKHKNFVFAGWYLFSDHDVKVTDFTNIEEDLKVIALYAGDRNNNGIDDDKDEVYTVTFIDGFNDSVIKTEDVLVGMDAQAPEAPTHRGYTFIGWDKGYTNITVDTEVTAEYNRNEVRVTTYTVTFIDGETNEVITTQNVREGNTATLPTPPVHENRVFVSWEGEYTNVNSNRTITATYTDDKNNNGIEDETEAHYDITYVDYNDEILEVIEDVLVDTLTPTIEDPQRENYEFKGWEPSVSEYVTGNATYKAEYTPINDENNNNVADEEEEHYTIIYNDYDGKLIKKFENVLVDTETPTVENPTREYYTFEKWTPEVAELVKEDATYVASYTINNDVDNDGVPDEIENKYIVNYYLISENDETAYKTFTDLVEGVETPIVEKPTREFYEFVKWNPEVAETVTKDINYVAQWDAKNDEDNDNIADEEEFKIEFIVDNKVVKTEYLVEGEMPTAPTVEDTNEDNRVFAGWNSEIVSATEDKQYIAQFKEDLDNDGYADENQYKVEFVLDGEVLDTQYLNEDELPQVPIVPQEIYPEKKVFDKWTPEIVANYEGQYIGTWTDDLNNNGKADKDETKFTITYLNKDGSEFVKFEDQLEGLATPQPENKPVAEGFVFDGWKDVAATISKDERYESKWLVDSDKDGIADEKEVKVEFYVDNKVEKTEYLMPGEKPTAPKVKDTDKDNRVFTGWTPEITEVKKEDKTVKYEATFEEDTNNDGYADEDQFLIEFYNKDEFVSSDYYNEGATVVAPTLDDPKNDGETHTGWDPEFNSTATASVRYDAVWETDTDNDNIADESEHEIKFIVDGKVVKTEYLSDNEMPTAPSIDEYDTEDDERVFANWRPEVVAATADAEYVAQFKDDVNNDGKADEDQFLIEFYNKGQFVTSNYYNEGATVVAPTLTDTDKDGEVHTGWAPKFSDTATASVRYDAVWDKDIDNDGVADKEQLLVQFVANNQTILSDYVTKGQPTPMPNPNAIPTVAGKAFYGWNPTVSEKVEVAVTYEALYGDDTDNDGKADITEIKIEFNINDELFETQYLQLNEMPVAPTPTKKGYILSAWTPEIEKVTGPQVYNATWLVDSNDDGTADEDQFLIEFYNKDEFVSSDYYNEGQTVVEPTLDDPKNDGETHTGWDPEFSATATGSVRYDAVWETDTDNDNVADEDEFTIEFIVDGQTVKTEYLTEGQQPTAPAMEQYDTNSDSRVFAEWNPALAPATADQQYEAVFTADINNDGIADSEQTLWTVKFYGNDNTTVISEQIVVDGKSATAPTAPTKTGYTFKNWDKEYSNVTSNLDVYPVFADETAPEVSLSSELQTENTEAKVTVNATDLGSGVKTIKYALGSKEAADFADVNAIDSTNFVVNVNGVYTVYVEDNAGNVTLKEIEITGIELAPSDEGKTEFKDEYVTITMSKLTGIWIPLVGTIKDYNLDFTLTADPETGAKIKEVRYHQGDFINWNNNYVSESHFESGCSRDEKVYDETDGEPLDKIVINLTTPYPDRFTIYVVYVLDGKEYTRLYKVRLAQFLNP